MPLLQQEQGQALLPQQVQRRELVQKLQHSLLPGLPLPVMQVQVQMQEQVRAQLPLEQGQGPQLLLLLRAWQLPLLQRVQVLVLVRVQQAVPLVPQQEGWVLAVLALQPPPVQVQVQELAQGLQPPSSPLLLLLLPLLPLLLQQQLHVQER